MPETPNERKLSRKEREQIFRMNIVLDAAEEVFANSPFAKASVEEIAEHAEISVGTLYNLFRSKEEIYRAVISRSQNLYFDVAEERVDNANGPRDKLHAAVSANLEHWHRFTNHLRLYVSATNGFQWEFKSKLAEEALARHLAFEARLADVCQAGMDDGTFKRGIPAEILATNVLAIPHSFLAVAIGRADGDILSMVPHAIAVLDRLLGTDAD